MSVVFSKDAKAKIDQVFSRYPQREAALLPVLWIAQDEFSFLSDEVRELVGQTVGVSRAKVDSVVSFYTMFNAEKKGTYHIQVCRTLPCYLAGVQEVLDVIEDQLHINVGETTKDQKFTLSEVECLGCCGDAPCMQINTEKYHENLTKEKVRQIVTDLQNGKDIKQTF